MGEIGRDRKEVLYELQLWEILAIIRGYRRRDRAIWESSRLQSFYILCAMGAKEIHSPQDLFMLPGEEDTEELAEPSAEEIIELKRMIREENEKLANK